MRKGIVAALAVVVVAGVAAAAVPLVERHAAAQIKSDMEADGSTKVGSVEVGLFARKVAFNDLHAMRPGEITIGHWEASGLAWPITELAKGRTPFSGLAPGDPVHAERLEVRNLRMVQDKARWSVDSLAISGLHLDRYESVAGPGQFSHLVARIAGALSMGHLEQKGTTFTDPASNDRVTIDSLVVDRFDKGQAGSIAVGGFEFTPKPPRDPVFRMPELKLTDLDFRRGVQAIGVVTWRPGVPIGRIDLGSASLSGFSGESFTRYGISLGSITQQSQSEGKDVRHSRLRIEGFVLDPPAQSREGLQIRLVLQAMGLKQLKLESDCAGTEDRIKGEISVDRCALTGPELGDVTLSFKLVQADAPFWKAIDEHSSFALLGTKAGLGGAKLVVADRGLVERSVKAVAATSGQSPAAVRASLAQEVRRFQPAGILITEDLSKLLDTVARFVESGGTLTLEAKPASPIGLDKMKYFTRPGPDLVDILGLSATLSR
ncbi:MAG: hypothetical protein E6G95_19390 [Alphaproteobacteria bacterium]|nr:MAG: hypothetical protein E6G95_19390 [Alphaproteobacteria bacterium]